MYHVKHYERGLSEVLKITRASNLIQPGLCYLELDGLKVGTVYAFDGCYDRIREALEEREATPEECYLLEEKTRRLENADALREIEEIAADGNLKAFRQICDIANAALRTAEESSVVGLIDRTPAKQPEGTTKLDKALQNVDVVKRVLVENSCPSEFALLDCEFNPESGCTLCCEQCWNEEVGE